MVFGSGGIYTEILKDTSMTLLPAKNFSKLIDSTKVSEILDGARGADPKSMTTLINTMEKLEKLALDFPEILSIDCNPVLVTEDRTICVDVKFVLN